MDKATWHAHTTLYLLLNSLKEIGVNQKIQILYKNRQYQLILEWIESDVDQFMRVNDT
jgi:two-component SAPR family response regulator